MKIAVLGGRGFIGTAIIKELTQEHKILTVKPEIDGSFDELIAFKPNLIINSCASRPDASENDSRVANFDYPLKVFNLISKKIHSPITWIQLASYYELELSFGRNDPYTRYKNEFRSYLHAKCLDSNIDMRILFLPHVIGRGERPNRFVSTAIKTINNNLDYRLEHPSINLPLLMIDDAVSAVHKFIGNKQRVASAYPIYYKSNRDLLEDIIEILGTKKVHIIVRSNSDLESKKVMFPPKVEGWEPLISLEDYILSVLE